MGGSEGCSIREINQGPKDKQKLQDLSIWNLKSGPPGSPEQKSRLPETAKSRGCRKGRGWLRGIRFDRRNDTAE